MLSTLIAVALLGGGPKEEVAKFRDAAKSLPANVVLPVFVSFIGTDGQPLAETETEILFNLVLNHVHQRTKMQYLRHIDPIEEGLPDVAYIDANELGWSLEQVKALTDRDPYFNQFQKPGEYLYIIRADFFIRAATFGRTYIDLLFGVHVKKAADVYKILGIQRPNQSDAANRAFNGGRTDKSKVNRTGERVIKWLAGLTGEPAGGFETDDLAINTKSGENVHEDIHNRGLLKADAHEAFGLLNNGCFWYLVFDADDNLLDAAADNVAQDTRKYVESDKLVNAVAERPSYLSTSIQNAHICMGCHGAGCRPYECWVATRIQNRGIRFFGNKDRVRNLIEDFYDWLKQGRLMAAVSKRYVEAIKEASGLDAAEAMALFARRRWEWEEEPLTLNQAAAEVRVTPLEFVQYVAMLKAFTPDSPGWQLRFRLARFFLVDKHDAKSAQAVLGLNKGEFVEFLKGGVPIKLGSNALEHLAAGGTISRFQWEVLGVYTEAAAVICYQKQAIKDATMQELIQAFKGEPITVIEVPVPVVVKQPIAEPKPEPQPQSPPQPRPQPKPIEQTRKASGPPILNEAGANAAPVGTKALFRGTDGRRFTVWKWRDGIWYRQPQDDKDDPPFIEEYADAAEGTSLPVADGTPRKIQRTADGSAIMLEKHTIAGRVEWLKP
jgi:hypothetical protein